MLRRAVMTLTKRYNKAAKGQSPRVLSTLAPTPPPKPWGQDVVESKGDYRQEAWLETHIGGPLYQHQEDLPRLPIPAVKETLERFLPTAVPLASSESEVQALHDAVQKFPTQAQLLQERLQDKASEYHDSSWLQHWWNTLGYLNVRDSLVINVSYYFHFADDTTIFNHATNPQIARAAALLFTTAQVRNQVVTGTWPPEVLGRGEKAKPLCATAYKYMFHACRIPDTPSDRVRMYDPALYTHAAVAVQGHFFKIPLVHPVTHEPVSMETLEASLQQAVEMAQQSTNHAQGLTWCTAQNRDAWAAARKSLDTQVLQDLQTLESAACLVCLDDVAVHTTRQMGHLLLHGKESATNDAPLNRWFDKSLQYIITKNGKAGFLGEHSMMDGVSGRYDH